MRGMATLEVFEELSCKEPDSPDVRKTPSLLLACPHTHTHRDDETNMHPCFVKTELRTDGKKKEEPQTNVIFFPPENPVAL